MKGKRKTLNKFLTITSRRQTDNGIAKSKKRHSTNHNIENQKKERHQTLKSGALKGYSDLAPQSFFFLIQRSRT